MTVARDSVKAVLHKKTYRQDLLLNDTFFCLLLQAACDCNKHWRSIGSYRITKTQKQALFKLCKKRVGLMKIAKDP